VDFERFVSVLYQDFLVVLLQELVFEIFLLLVAKVHDRLPSMHVQNCHGHRVVNLVEHEKHNTVADLELIKVVMAEDIKHLVSS